MTNNQLRAVIDAWIKANGNNEITGPILNDVLQDIVDTYELRDIRLFAQESTPTAIATGDMWYKASTNVLSNWTGAIWDPFDLTGNVTFFVTTAERLAIPLVNRWVGMTLYDTDLNLDKTLIINPGGATTTETDWIDSDRMQQKNDNDIIIPANGEITISKLYDYRRMSISGGDTVINGISIVPNIPVYGGLGFRYNIESPAKLVGDLNTDVQYLFCSAGVTITNDWDPSDGAYPARNSIRPIITSTGEDMVLGIDTIIVLRYDNFAMVWYVVGAAVSAATPTVNITYQIQITDFTTQDGRIQLQFTGGSSTIDWGDGTVDTLSTGVTKTHQYSANGVYDITIYASDATTSLDISNSFIIGAINNIADLTELNQLFCNDNDINILDVSTLVLLTIIDCANNVIPVLNVTNLVLLTSLDCANNVIPVLNVTNLVLLTQLLCSDNSISTLDVALLTSLTVLSCSDNSISVLNVTNLVSLTQLLCSGNSISTLDVTLLTSLTVLSCSNNSISVLNVVPLSSLTQLFCSNNSITTLTVGGLTNLTILRCESNSISTLAVSALTSLTFLNCSDNSITTLNVTNLVLMDKLFCFDNFLITTLDVSGMTSIRILSCSNNIINVLAINSTIIEEFSFSSNGMTSGQVDTIWIALNATTLVVGGIGDGGGTNAAPTATSSAARTNLTKLGGAPPSDWSLTI